MNLSSVLSMKLLSLKVPAEHRTHKILHEKHHHNKIFKCKCVHIKFPAFMQFSNGYTLNFFIASFLFLRFLLFNMLSFASMDVIILVFITEGGRGWYWESECGNKRILSANIFSEINVVSKLFCQGFRCINLYNNPYYKTFLTRAYLGFLIILT